MARTSHVGPELFQFLRDLRRNNDREWFAENRERYERDLRGPLLRLINDFGPRLRKISRAMVADPRPIGGSLFRIHRDTRFAKDKSPYKTHAACHFRHEDTSKDVHGPGFYLHLEPGSVFVAGGMWRPEADSLARIRDGIVASPPRWRKAIAGLELGGAELKRPPRGYDQEHPLVRDLRRTDFITSVTLSEKHACAPAFLDDVDAACRKMAPLMAFLAKAVGLAFGVALALAARPAEAKTARAAPIEIVQHADSSLVVASAVHGRLTGQSRLPLALRQQAHYSCCRSERETWATPRSTSPRAPSTSSS